MSTEQWKALAKRCYYWANPGRNDPDSAAERDEFEQWETSPWGFRHIGEVALPLTCLGLFAQGMALLTSEVCICQPGWGHRSGAARDPADGDKVIDCPKPGPGGVPTWASNREPNATPVHRIMAALVKVPEEKLKALAEHVERLAGWDRAGVNVRDAQAADELADLARGPRL